MAEQYRRKALMDAFGVEEDEQQPDPVGPRVEASGMMPDLEHTMSPGPGIDPTDPRLGQMAGSEPSATPAVPDYRKAGKYTSTAYDAGKMQRPWDEMSEKYRIGTVLSNFDPSQGLTPEVIDALNKADIFGAKFSGAGDKLTVDNAGGHARFGKGGTADVNIGFKTGNGTWGAWTDPELEAQAAAQGGMGGGMNSGLAGAQSNLNGLLRSDFQSAIQAALAKMTNGGAPNLQALLQQLGGGQ